MVIRSIQVRKCRHVFYVLFGNFLAALDVPAGTGHVNTTDTTLALDLFNLLI